MDVEMKTFCCSHIQSWTFGLFHQRRGADIASAVESFLGDETASGSPCSLSYPSFVLTSVRFGREEEQVSERRRGLYTSAHPLASNHIRGQQGSLRKEGVDAMLSSVMFLCCPHTRLLNADFVAGTARRQHSSLSCRFLGDETAPAAHACRWYGLWSPMSGDVCCRRASQRAGKRVIYPLLSSPTPFHSFFFSVFSILASTHHQRLGCTPSTSHRILSKEP